MKKTSLHLLLLILSSLAACTMPKAPTPESGVSHILAIQRKALISDLEYSLFIKVPEAKEQAIKGESTLKFNLKDRKTTWLDFKADDSQLHQLIINNDTLVDAMIINEHIELPRKNLRKGCNTVTIKFTLGDGALNRNKDYFYALFVPDRARTALPCFDQPDLKGSFAVTMDLPKEWSGVANGPLVVKQEFDERMQLEFAASKPISTYLWAFTAGNYQYTSRQWKGKEIGLFHMVEDSVKFNRNIEEVFRQTTASLDWLEDFTQHDYPFEKYNLVAIPSFQFGGMEHPGATYYRSEIIFLDEKPTRNEELRRANLIAHETAHMWFGDLVTMPWFDEVWLKEVFANFMADKITEPWFPEMNHQLRFMLAHFPQSYGVDRTPGANPIGQKLANLKNAGTLYGGIIYHKSPIVMMHLESMAGKEKLQKGIREYVANYAYGNASWNQLIECVDKYTDVDLKVWSQSWVYEPGRPVIYFEPSDQGDNKWLLVQKEEHQGLSTPHTIWPQEVRVMQEKTPYEYEFFNLQKPVGEDLEKASNLFLADEKGYGLVRMTAPQIDYWLKETHQLNDPLLRGRSAINLYENLLDGNIPPLEFYQYLLNAINKENNPLLLNLFSSHLHTTYWYYLPDHQREAQQTITEKTLWNNMLAKADAAQKKTLFRRWSDLGQSEKVVKQLGRLLSGEDKLEGITLSERDRMDLLRQVCIKQHPQYKELQEDLMNSLKSEHNKDKLKFLLPSLSNNPGERDAFFQALSKLENRAKESWVESGLWNLHHPLRARNSQKYLLKTLEMLEEIQITGDIFFPIGWLDSSFSGHSNMEAFNIADKFLEERPDYPEHLRLKVLQNTDQIKRAAEVKKKFFE